MPVELTLDARDDDGPGEPPADGFVGGRAYVASYTAQVAAPRSGGFLDLRVTTTDEAGNTLSQGSSGPWRSRPCAALTEA